MSARQVVSLLVFGFLFAGCSLVGGAARSGEPVQLATYDGATGACLLDFHEAFLVTDPVAGTALALEAGGTSPLLWPSGYFGRRVGSEVVVYSGSGKVVATTGRWWLFAEDPGISSDDGKFRQCAEAPLTEAPPPPSASVG